MSSLETNMPRINPETSVQNEVQPTTIAMGGIRRFITYARLAWNEEKLDNLESHDHIIMQASAGAEQIRGFGSEPESPETIAKSPTEKLAALHREGQVRRIRRAEIDKYRISQVHPTSVGANEAIPTKLARPRPAAGRGSVDAKKWEQRRASLDSADRGKMASFETSKHMKPSEKRAIRKAETYHSIRSSQISTRNRRLTKGAEGTSVPGKIRQWRINRTGRQIDKLRNRLNTARNV